MKNIKENAIVRFVVALFVVGIVTGIIFYILYKPDVIGYMDEFKKLNGHQNVYLQNVFLVSAIFVLSISVVGMPFLMIFLFYEGMSVGFTFAVCTALYSIKGIAFYFLYFLVSKLVTLAIILYFLIISISYVFKFIDGVISKNKEAISSSITKELYRFLIVFGAIILNSTFIYLFGNKIVLLFIGLIR